MTRSLIIPDGPYLEPLSTRAWNGRRASVAWLAAYGPWMVGDFINMAPSDDAWAEWMNDYPALSARDTAEQYLVASRIPPSERRAGLSWAKHEHVHELPTAGVRAALDRAEAENLTEQQLDQIAADYKKAAKIRAQQLIPTEGQR